MTFPFEQTSRRVQVTYNYLTLGSYLIIADLHQYPVNMAAPCAVDWNLCRLHSKVQKQRLERQQKSIEIRRVVVIALNREMANNEITRVRRLMDGSDFGRCSTGHSERERIEGGVAREIDRELEEECLTMVEKIIAMERAIAQERRPKDNAALSEYEQRKLMVDRGVVKTVKRLRKMQVELVLERKKEVWKRKENEKLCALQLKVEKWLENVPIWQKESRWVRLRRSLSRALKKLVDKSDQNRYIPRPSRAQE